MRPLRTWIWASEGHLGTSLRVESEGHLGTSLRVESEVILDPILDPI